MRAAEHFAARRRSRAAGAAALAALLLLASAGCGGDTQQDKANGGADSIAAARKVDTAQFPAADGKRTLRQIEAAASAREDASLLPAANDFVAGRENRLPFGVFDLDRNFLWGPTVVYFARSASAPAEGSVAAQPHALAVAPRYRSRSAQTDYAQIGNGFYAVDFRPPAGTRKLDLLALTKTGGATHAGASGVIVRAGDPAPAPGERVPAIDTPTIGSSGGDVAKIDTRDPPDKMHDVSLKTALRQHKPIVLIFATPALCSSRVCGPVVDVASEVQAKLGRRVVFIHQEIYKHNDPNAGYRPQVAAFGLTSEPFTFVIAPNGKVVRQLQGPFDQGELEAAIAAARAAG